MEFYKILESVMEEKGLSIPDIARLSNLSDSTIRSIINRKSKSVALDVAFKISKGLNIPLEELNGERETKGENTSFSDNLKKIRIDSGLTQQQVAEALGITKATYSGYETGRRQPDVAKIKQLAEILGISGDELLETGFEIEKSSNNKFTTAEIKHIEKYRVLNDRRKKIVDDVLEELYINTIPQPKKDKLTQYIDICKYEIAAGAGIGSYLQDQEYTLVRVPGNTITAQADYAVGVSGKSMEPDFQDGDTVLVKSMPCINVGETGIFVVNGDAYIKKLGDGRLISTNKDYNDIVLSEYDTVTCLGKVIGKI